MLRSLSGLPIMLLMCIITVRFERIHIRQGLGGCTEGLCPFPMKAGNLTFPANQWVHQPGSSTELRGPEILLGFHWIIKSSTTWLNSLSSFLPQPRGPAGTPEALKPLWASPPWHNSGTLEMSRVFRSSVLKAQGNIRQFFIIPQTEIPINTHADYVHSIYTGTFKKKPQSQRE